jgi:anti-sigma B factor antagonist
MNYAVTMEDGEAVLAIEGELDAITAPELRDTIDSLIIGAADGVRVDLTKLRLIDSSGVGALVSLYKRLRAEGRHFHIVGLCEQPLAIFRLLRLDEVLTTAPAA